MILATGKRMKNHRHSPNKAKRKNNKVPKLKRIKKGK